MLSIAMKWFLNVPIATSTPIDYHKQWHLSISVTLAPKVIFMYILSPRVQKRTYRKIYFLSKQIILLALF